MFYRLAGKKGTPKVDTKEGSCPSKEWKPWANDCYLFLANHFVSWEQGEAECVEKGGHMASVHSEDENSFIRTSMFAATSLPFHRDFWIGYRKSAEGVTGTSALVT